MKRLLILTLFMVTVLNQSAATETNRAIYTHSDWRKTTAPPSNYGLVLKENEYIIDNMVFRLQKEEDYAVVVRRYSIDDKYDGTHECDYNGYLIIPDSIIVEGTVYPVRSIESNIISKYAKTITINYFSLPKTIQQIDCLCLSDDLKIDTLDIPEISFLEEVKMGDDYYALTNKYKDGGDVTLSINRTTVTDLVLPEGMTTMKRSYHHFNFRSITFPSTMKTVAPFRFGNKYLEKLVLKEGVDTFTIKEDYFANNLKEIIIPKSLKAFHAPYDACMKIMELVPFESWKNVWITLRALKHRSCEHLVVPEGVKELVGYSTGPINETDWGPLSKITISSTVERIGSSFSKADYLWCVEIPSNTSLKEIGDYAFKYTSLREINLPESVYNIGQYAFSFTRLRSIKLPNSITTLKKGVFENAEYLTAIEIPNSVKTIENSAFDGCEALKSVKMSSSIETIESCAFRSTAIEEIRLPKSLKSLSTHAFDQHKKIDIYVYGPPATIIYSSSDNYPPSMWILHVLPEYKDAYETADYWKEFQRIRTFEPDGIESIKTDTDNDKPKVYDLQGREQGNGVRGINIIKTSDGKMKKIWKK